MLAEDLKIQILNMINEIQCDEPRDLKTLKKELDLLSTEQLIKKFNCIEELYFSLSYDKRI